MIENNREIRLDDYLSERKAIDDPHDQSLFDFLYMTGCRITEALTTKARDINFQELQANILTEKNPHDPYRTVSLCPTLNKANELLENVKSFVSQKQPHEPIWNFQTKQDRKRAWLLSKRHFNCTVHSFRHTHAIHLVRDVGLSQVELMQEMGWWKLDTCMSYLKYQTKENIKRKILQSQQA